MNQKGTIYSGIGDGSRGELGMTRSIAGQSAV